MNPDVVTCSVSHGDVVLHMGYLPVSLALDLGNKNNCIIFNTASIQPLSDMHK